MKSNQEQATFSCFWRRSGAFVIDVLLTGAFGFGLGLVFFYQLAWLGPYGRLVGFCIAGLYFAIFNSSICKGQTLGKAILKIRVINRDGSFLNPLQAFLRFCVLGIPLILGNLPVFSVYDYTAVGMVLKPMLTVGIALASIYFVIFNQKTQQTLHDMLVGSYVVRKDVKAVSQSSPIWTGHYVLAVLIIGVVFLFSLYNQHQLRTPQMQEIHKAKNEIMKLTNSWKVSITNGEMRRGETNYSYYAVRFVAPVYRASEVNFRFTQKDKDIISALVANAIIENIPASEKADLIIVYVSYGFEIGIARLWRGRREFYAPDEWKSRLKLQSEGGLL